MNSNNISILVTGAGGPAEINTINLLRKYYKIISTDTNPFYLLVEFMDLF